MDLQEIKRCLEIELSENNAFFLWGPRKTGKTTYLKERFPDAVWFDFLDTRQQAELSIYPHLFRERILADRPKLVIVDEVQKVPKVLDEIHWCLENTKTKFILCGSSAKALKREAVNLLGGRAWRYEMFPLTSFEIPDFELGRALNHGLLPQHYLSNRPEKFLRGYIVDYLHEEVQKEAKVRNIMAFERFLDMVAKSHGQLINYTNIARDCGVSATTVRSYFQILEDTLLGFRLPPWKESKSRRMIETEKFYLFDVGLVKALWGVSHIEPGTDLFGHAFEHFILQEIRAYLAYNDKAHKLRYWRTSSQLEVDIIIGNMDAVIECKASRQVRSSELKGLSTLIVDESPKKSFVVSLEENARQLENGALIVSYREFLKMLWEGGVV